MSTLAPSPIAKKSLTKKIASDEESGLPVEDNNLDIGFDPDPAKVYVFELLKKKEAHTIENLGSRCKIYDPSLKRYREIRYIPVAPTIFQEEQHESYDEYPEVPLSFNRNQLLAKGSDRRLMEYLFMHDLFENSPFKISNKPAMFKLADKEIEDKITAKRNAKEYEALTAIRDKNIDDLKPIARIIFGITDTGETGIRNAMEELVKKDKKGFEKSNAEKVLENLINPNLDRKYYIQSALDNGVIASDRNRMRLAWVEGDVFICNLSTVNQTAIVNEVSNWSLTEEGKKWYSVLRTKI